MPWAPASKAPVPSDYQRDEARLEPSRTDGAASRAYASPSTLRWRVFGRLDLLHKLRRLLQLRASQHLHQARKITLAKSGGCAELDFSSIPSMFPCSVSTHIQSNPHLAMTRAWLVPGSICHAPNVRPEPVRRALWRRLVVCILNF